MKELDFLSILEESLYNDSSIDDISRLNDCDEDGGTLKITLIDGSVYSVSYQLR